jgi:hypothetical protein
VKVDFEHNTSPLTEDHMEDCNGWELASRAGLDGVSRSQWWASTTAFTQLKEAAALVMNGGEGRRDVQKRCYHLGEFVSHLCKTS